MKISGMTPRLRKLALTAHLTVSVGWLGAVAGFLVLSIAGLTSQDDGVVRGAYISMNLIGLFIIVPLSIAALATGIVQSLATEWGLIRFYWVLVKLILTIGSTLLLLLHQFTAVAGAAKLVSDVTAGTVPSLGGMGTQLVGDAGLAILVLLMLTTISLYKPWGLTRYGRRKLPQRPVSETPLGLKIFLAAIGVMAAVGFVLMHLSGVGHRYGGH